MSYFKEFRKRFFEKLSSDNSDISRYAVKKWFDITANEILQLKKLDDSVDQLEKEEKKIEGKKDDMTVEEFVKYFEDKT